MLHEIFKLTPVYKSIFIISIIVNFCLFLIFLLTQQYNPFLIFFHLLTLLFFWFLVFRACSFNKLIKNKKEILIIVLLLISAFFIRIFQIGNITPGIYSDELTIAKAGEEILMSSDFAPFVPVNFGHPTPLLYLEGISINLFGNSIAAIRLPSIIMGSLAVIAFYVLLRLFLSIRFSLLGSILMIFQYTNLVLSRLAYEPQASLFFQIITLIFLALYYKSKEKIFLIAVGLSLAAGLYTYLNFRIFAVVVCIITLILISKKQWKSYFNDVLLFLIVLFVAAMPLLSYAIIQPHNFSGRVSEISIFSRGYSTAEFTKELWANTYRTILLPFIGIPDQNPPFSGDPNPGRNPSGVPLFDPMISVLAVLGFLYLFRKKRWLFFICIILIIPPLLSDIFSTEIIPNDHYYGLGHPNTLRISGIIGLIVFSATFGLYAISQGIKNKYIYNVVYFIVIVACLINIYWYFGQQTLNRKFYLYNYKVNHADEMQLYNYLNTLNIKELRMTHDFTDNNEYLQFFLSPTITVKTFKLSSAANLLKEITSSEATVIEVNKNTVVLLNTIIQNGYLENAGYKTHEIKGIVDQPDFIIFEKGYN